MFGNIITKLMADLEYEFKSVLLSVNYDTKSIQQMFIKLSSSPSSSFYECL